MITKQPTSPPASVMLPFSEILKGGAKLDAKLHTTLTFEQVKQIIADHMLKLGLHIDPASIQPTTHTDGQYEDSREVIDGFQFDIDGIITVEGPPGSTEGKP